MLRGLMVTVLIVIGVIAFLAIDGYVLYRVFKSRATADDYGTFAVPGEITLMLRPGKLKLNYQEAVKAPSDSSGGIDFGVPTQLEVSVVSPAGESLDLKGPGFGGMGSSLSTGLNWSRALIGTVEVAQPGEHTVTARGELPDAIEPTILVGK